MTKALLCIKTLYRNISRNHRNIVFDDEIDSYKIICFIMFWGIGLENA